MIASPSPPSKLYGNGHGDRGYAFGSASGSTTDVAGASHHHGTSGEEGRSFHAYPMESNPSSTSISSMATIGQPDSSAMSHSLTATLSGEGTGVGGSSSSSSGGATAVARTTSSRQHRTMAADEFLALLIEKRLARDARKSVDGASSPASDHDSLNLSHMRLGEVPEEVPSIIQDDIVRLAMSYNSIQTLPRTFASMAHLRYLNLRSNLITRFPDVLTQMPALEILDISKNKIRKLPDEPGRLLSLRVLSVGRNRLQRLPTWIASMRSVRVLDLEQNPLQWPPPHVTIAPSESTGGTSGSPASDAASTEQQQQQRKLADDRAHRRWIASLQHWIQENRLQDPSTSSPAASNDASSHPAGPLSRLKMPASSPRHQQRQPSNTRELEADSSVTSVESMVTASGTPMPSTPTASTSADGIRSSPERSFRMRPLRLTKPTTKPDEDGSPVQRRQSREQIVPEMDDSETVQKQDSESRDVRPSTPIAQRPTDVADESSSITSPVLEAPQHPVIPSSSAPSSPILTRQGRLAPADTSMSPKTPSSRLTLRNEASTSKPMQLDQTTTESPKAAAVRPALALSQPPARPTLFSHARNNSSSNVPSASSGLSARKQVLNSKKSLPDLRSQGVLAARRRSPSIGNLVSPFAALNSTLGQSASSSALHRKTPSRHAALLAGVSVATPPALDASADHQQAQRDSYFKRLSTFPAKAHAAAAVLSPATLRNVDATRGILFALSQVFTALKQYTSFATDERIAAQFSRVLDVAGGTLEELIDALDRCDSYSLRGQTNSQAVAKVLGMARTCVDTFRKVASVLKLQLKAIQQGADVRYTRSLLLMLYGAVVEVGHSWQEISTNSNASQLGTSASVPPPAPSTHTTPSAMPVGLPPIAEAETPPRPTRRRLGSIGSVAVPLGSQGPPSADEGQQTARRRQRPASKSVGDSSTWMTPSSSLATGSTVGAALSLTAPVAPPAAVLSAQPAVAAPTAIVDEHLLALVQAVTSTASGAWVTLLEHLESTSSIASIPGGGSSTNGLLSPESTPTIAPKRVVLQPSDALGASKNADDVRAPSPLNSSAGTRKLSELREQCLSAAELTRRLQHTLEKVQDEMDSRPPAVNNSHGAAGGSTSTKFMAVEDGVAGGVGEPRRLLDESVAFARLVTSLLLHIKTLSATHAKALVALPELKRQLAALTGGCVNLSVHLTFCGAGGGSSAMSSRPSLSGRAAQRINV